MRDPQVLQRRAVKVHRNPITSISESGERKVGGIFIFDNPYEHPDLSEIVSKTPGKIRVLWCPYCAAFHYFSRVPETTDLWKCVSCGISTNAYYVKYANNLWWEGVPLKDIRKVMSI